MNAVISPCGIYRYRLDREIAAGLLAPPTGGRVLWVMLNPSTADASNDDPTMRRVIDFSRKFGFTGLTVVNLFALRATKPTALLEHDDPIGPECDHHIELALLQSAAVICAWGSSVPKTYASRPSTVLSMIRASGTEPSALGTTEAGYPRHPLYMPKNANMQPFGAEVHT